MVSLLVDRKANVEHRAKTGLTPLMEAASGGYAEVREHLHFGQLVLKVDVEHAHGNQSLVDL